MNEQPENKPLHDHLWKPGQSGNPAGRPAGSKDKKWASLDYWFGLVETEWQDIKPETRVKVAIEAWKALLARKQVATAEESVSNTEATMKMLKMLQDMSNGNNPNAGVDQRSVAVGMDNGRPASQAEASPASSLPTVL